METDLELVLHLVDAGGDLVDEVGLGDGPVVLVLGVEPAVDPGPCPLEPLEGPAPVVVEDGREEGQGQDGHQGEGDGQGDLHHVVALLGGLVHHRRLLEDLHVTPDLVPPDRDHLFKMKVASRFGFISLDRE